jgi:CRISPR-associated endonuclease/helicase Cas3/CRISPR-associated endonuclease Cas3-HD
MSFDQYISHPAITDDGEPTLLIGEDGKFDSDGHLRAVADRMGIACEPQRLSSGTSADAVSEVIGLTHDFAKLTSWAQKHLRNQPFQKSDRYRYHSFPSALVTLYCMECRSDTDEYDAELATLVVADHHNTSSPPDPEGIAKRFGRTGNEIAIKYQTVKDQFHDIDAHAADCADRILQTATHDAGSWDNFLEWHNSRTTPINEVHEHLKYFARLPKRDHQVAYYTDIVRLWTALKFADQSAASGLTQTDLDGRLPNRDKLAQHIESLDQGSGTLSKLNNLRDQARKEVTRNIDSLLDSDDVGLITLPTGFGKTYAGLSAGLKAAESNNSRLIYILPYTSILDQTAREIQSIFSVSPYSKSFTLHHHLSDTYTGLGDRYTDADIGRSPGALHAESWLSGLTLSTTVQLFESLTAPTARQATRIPSLHDAVVVIDEPQAIPEDWWQIVPQLVSILVNGFDATVVLMTATQPGLIQYGSESVGTQELTDSPQPYIDFLAEHPRVRYKLHHTVRGDSCEKADKIDYATAGRRVIDSTTDESDTLAICNTRASAEDLYKSVTRIAQESDDNPVELGRLFHDYVAENGELPTPVQLRQRALKQINQTATTTVYAFLSGDVRPDDRSVLIDTLYNNDAGDGDDPDPLLETDVSVILISTSVVEAGVDVSFQTVFRDYAPIPNIVQSGGRCNRSFSGDIGDVIIWCLDVPEGGYSIPSLVIHGGSGGDALPLLAQTGQVLRDNTDERHMIDESTMVSDVVSEFYESLFHGELDPGDEGLSEAVATAEMSALENERMIDERKNYDDVIAVLTTDERDDLLTGELSVGDLSRHAGAQVNTAAESWTREMTLGNSRYLVVDARDGSYHPVFGIH